MSSSVNKTIIADYTAIALYAAGQGALSQRDTICKPIYSSIDAIYKTKPGYVDDVNLGLGCGFPFDYASIKPGDTVADFGCGAGIDTFIAAEMVGNLGKVFGIDITPKLLQYGAYFASKNNKIDNVTFIHADVAATGLDDNSVDVVISNGVFSLVADLQKVFSEAFRILRPGGVFSFSDMVSVGVFSTSVLNNVHYFTGCLNGIKSHTTYLETLQLVGFTNIKVEDERKIELPADIIETSPDPIEYQELIDGLRRFQISTISSTKPL